MAQIRRNPGAYLRSIRLKRKMALDQVIAELDLLRIKCSKSALSRIERDLISCKLDLLAGLCILYEISSDEILFRGKQKTS